MVGYRIRVNGEEHIAMEDVNLLRYFRDELKLKSVKDGCSEGACGTCTVLVDGKPTRACVLKTSKAEGKEILTVEGLSEREKEAFIYGFGEAGAVQCGFCIPGMVISGKAIIDNDPNPSREEIIKGIKNNICRCTGYKKIIDGIELAAAVLRGDRQIAGKVEGIVQVGQDIPRVDVREKVLGTGEFADDVEKEGMVYASAVRTKYPRAKVLDIDVEKALALPGVLAVYTAEDVPVNKIGHIQQDWDVFIAKGEITRCVGDAICLVVAEDEKTLAEGKSLVEIQYEELEPIRSIKEALAPDAPSIHPNGNICQQKFVARGDADGVLKTCKYVLTKNFTTPFTEHAFMEPECSVAYPYGDWVKVYSSDQGIYAIRKEIAIMLDTDPENIVVENKLVGGAFGGKEDSSVQHLAALASYKLKRPVKVKFTRQESLNFHPKRHAMEAKFTIGCDENGVLQAMKADIFFDTGAYASLCGPVLERACTHAVGPYTYQNTQIRGFGIYTNNPPAGAFRGFGVCQSCFAIESLLNLMAEKVGISPWEIRYRNAIEPGKVLPNGQITDPSTGLKETLEAIKPIYDAHKYVGIACAMKNAGVGVGLPDKGRCRLVIENGIAQIYTGATCLGQGLATVLNQIGSQTAGLSLDQIYYNAPNTECAPDSGMSSGSRQTLITGEATRMVFQQLADDLKEKTLEELEGKEYFAEYFEPTDPITSTKPNPKSHIAYGYATQLVILNDEGMVTDVYAAHAVGKAVNPKAVEGQVEGGVIMGLGYALTEYFPLEDCVPKVKFGTLGLLRSNQCPEIHSIVIEKPGVDVTYGAVGVGEITTIPTAPAAQGAYYAYDGDFRQSLPLRNIPYKNRKPVYEGEPEIPSVPGE